MSGYLWEAGLGVGGLRDRRFSLLVFWNIVCLFIVIVYTYHLYCFLQNLEQFLKHNGK